MCVRGGLLSGSFGLVLDNVNITGQNSQLPVGCMPDCGLVGWTSKVT